MLASIETKVKELEPLLIEIRRYLHQNPELSGKEYNTTSFLNQKLQEYGINSKIIETDAGPAVIANIGNNKNKKTIALRADIDALPLDEPNNFPYCSKANGIMHACGHDFNMASVLGAGFLLKTMENEINTNIKLVFQPSEESALGGALAVVKTGELKDIDAILTVHANPSIDTGKIGIKSGAITAAIDMFNIKVKAAGGHSARPHLATDAIFTVNKIVDMLYSHITRCFDPITPIVLSVGKINGGTASNIIADSCQIEGTLRTLDNKIRSKIKTMIGEKVEKLAKIYDTEAIVEWREGPSPVYNDEQLSKLVLLTANNIIGSDNIIIIDEPSMGAEDFSAYLDKTPGMLIRIGTGGQNCCHPLHSCQFKIDENAISVAVKILTASVLNYSSNV